VSQEERIDKRRAVRRMESRRDSLLLTKIRNARKLKDVRSELKASKRRRK
jgi:hypothetical protein